MILRQGRLLVILLLTFLVCFSVPVYLQSQTQLATLVGTVTDSTGAVVPGVTITVTNVGTGIKSTTVTNETGDYVVPALSVGEYIITAELPGFKTLIRKGVVLQIAQKARADLGLQIGERSETVAVEGSAPLITSETAELGQVIDNRTVTELPLNGREFVQLVHLSPGANAGPPGAPAGGFAFPAPAGAPTTGTASLNGGSPEGIVYLLDGAENTDKFLHQAVIRPSIDVIQEFKVQDKLMSAEYGGTGTGVISVTTKSGTNQFRGAVWEFLRNDVLDARSFFDANKPPRRRNQFGGVVGGPVVIPGLYDGRNRTFFMASYEGTRFRSAGTAFGTVPTAAMKAGDFSAVVPDGQLFDPFTIDPATGLRVAFPDNKIPASRINPTSAKLLTFFPDPNGASTSPIPGRLANNYSRALRQTENYDQVLAKIDHKFGEKDRLFGRYAYGYQVAPSEGLLPLSDNSSYVRANSFVLSYSHFFSPNTINEAKFLFGRRNPKVGPDSFSIKDFNQNYGFDSRQPGVPPLYLTGLSTLGSNATLFHTPSTSYSASDNFTKILRGHTFKLGFLHERIGVNTLAVAVGGGSRSFNGSYSRQIGSPANTLEGRSFADYLLGVATEAGGLNVDSTAARNTPRFSNYSAFIQDDWKVSNKLTLNLGLRYDLFLPAVTTNGYNATFFDFATGELVYPENSPIKPGEYDWPYRKQKGNRETSTDYNNFGPRFGFAYRLGSGTQTVIRGGYGIYYEVGILAVAFDSGQSPPFFKSKLLTASPDEKNPAKFLMITTDVAPANVPLNPPVSFKSRMENTKTGLMQQWSLFVERELMPGTALSAGYVGWKSDHFLVDTAINYPVTLGPGNPQDKRPYPKFGSSLVKMDTRKANYHALNAKLEQRLGHGLSYLAVYAWAHGIDNAESMNGSTMFQSLQRGDPNNSLAFERGPSEQDIRQRFVLSTVYELPIGKSLSGFAGQLLSGWQVSGIYTAQGGWPFTPLANTALLNVGGRKSLYANSKGIDGNLPRSEKTVERWFDVAAFSEPPPYTYGNSGRGVLRTDGISNVDLSISKNFQFSETKRLQFRSEIFNLANHAHFGLPNANISSASAGRITTTFNTGRQIQFGLKMNF